MKKTQKGITLIALIITIIILLILAGVTLSMTLGNNGIFKLAQDASKNYVNAAEKEKAELAKVEEYIENTRETVTIPKEEYENLREQVAKMTPVKVEGTTNSSAGWKKVADYPEGFDISNTLVLDFKIILSSNNLDADYTSSTIQLRNDGIYFWANVSSRFSKPIEIYLVKK